MHDGRPMPQITGLRTSLKPDSCLFHRRAGFPANVPRRSAATRVPSLTAPGTGRRKGPRTSFRLAAWRRTTPSATNSERSRACALVVLMPHDPHRYWVASSWRRSGRPRFCTAVTLRRSKSPGPWKRLRLWTASPVTTMDRRWSRGSVGAKSSRSKTSGWGSYTATASAGRRRNARLRPLPMKRST